MQNEARLGLGRGCSWRDHVGGCEGDGCGGTWGRAHRTRGTGPPWHHKQGDSHTPYRLPAPTAPAPTVGAGNGKTTQLHPRT